MARIPLVGSAEVLTPNAVAASECTNLYPEVIESPDDRQKNVAVLKTRPGAHLLIDLGVGARIRGFFSCQAPNGDGRLFVVAGNTLFEIGIGTYVHGNPSTGAGTIISSNVLPSGVSLPGTDTVYIFGNPNQLCIVADKTVYYDNGAGPVVARFLLGGTATYAAGVVTWQSGDQFTPEMAGRAISLNGEYFTVTGYTDATHVTIGSAPTGARAGVCTLWYEGQVYGTSGDDFTEEMVGKPIVIGGKTYTVKQVFTENALQLVETDNDAVTTGAVWGTLSTDMLFECDGGDMVSALSGCYVGSTAFVNRIWGGSPDLGRQVAYSDPDDFTKWRPANFFTKQGNPDYVQRVAADRDLVVVVGTSESEIWQIDPSTGNPVRLQNATAKEGTVARHTVNMVGGMLLYLGGNPSGELIAYKLNGFTPERISTHAIEAAWAQRGALSSAVTSSAYTLGGHQLYVIHFPILSPLLSWAYDITASQQLGYPVWHQLAGWNPSAGGGNGDFGFYPYHHHTYIAEWGAGMHIVGGPNSGEIFELSADFGDDDGDEIHWRRTIPYRYNGAERAFSGPMELITSTPRPEITRDSSDDDGATFANARSIASGRLRWRRNGASRNRLWRFYGSGTDPLTLIDLQCEEAPGSR